MAPTLNWCTVGVLYFVDKGDTAAKRPRQYFDITWARSSTRPTVDSWYPHFFGYDRAQRTSNVNIYLIY